MTTPAESDRIARIEAEIRRWKRLAIMAIVLAVAAIAAEVWTLRTPTELQIANPDGGKLILRADGFVLFDPKGSVVASLSVDHESSRLRLSAAGGATVELSAHAIASINLSTASKSAMLSVSKEFSELTMLSRGEVAALSASDLGSRLSLGAEHGIVVLESGGPQLYPRAQLSAKDNAVVLEANPHGSTVQISDLSARHTLTSAP